MGNNKSWTSYILDKIIEFEIQLTVALIIYLIELSRR